jgi:hypothetical protein
VDFLVVLRGASSDSTIGANSSVERRCIHAIDSTDRARRCTSVNLPYRDGGYPYRATDGGLARAVVVGHRAAALKRQQRCASSRLVPPHSELAEPAEQLAAGRPGRRLWFCAAEAGVAPATVIVCPSARLLVGSLPGRSGQGRQSAHFGFAVVGIIRAMPQPSPATGCRRTVLMATTSRSARCASLEHHAIHGEDRGSNR